jgi:hypothetical protein
MKKNWNRVVRFYRRLLYRALPQQKNAPTSTFSSCEQPDRTTARRVVLAAWLPLIPGIEHGDSTSGRWTAPERARRQGPSRHTFPLEFGAALASPVLAVRQRASCLRRDGGPLLPDARTITGE